MYSIPFVVLDQVLCSYKSCLLLRRGVCLGLFVKYLYAPGAGDTERNEAGTSFKEPMSQVDDRL